MHKRILSGLTLAAASMLSMNAYAVAEGFYMGAMFGPSTNGASQTNAQTRSGTPPTTPVTPKSSQFGSRLFLGNKFNSYASIEFGVAFYSRIKYDDKGVETCNSPQIRAYDIDLLAKGEMQLGGFSIFGKLGPAVVSVNESGSLSPDLSKPCGETNRSINVKPELGIGVGYDLNQNWVFDLSATRLFVGGKASTIDMYAFGISYHFVDQYCGQFLCE